MMNNNFDPAVNAEAPVVVFCHCPLESDTRRLAAELAASISSQYHRQQSLGQPFSACIWLQGDLGAGKTTLARELLQSLGVTERIKSPTYALIEEYRSNAGQSDDNLLAELPLLHLDLYRLSDAEELEYIGVPEILAESLALIEWPQQGKGWLPEADLSIQIDDQASGRMFIVQAQTPMGEKLISLLSTRF